MLCVNVVDSSSQREAVNNMATSSLDLPVRVSEAKLLYTYICVCLTRFLLQTSNLLPLFQNMLARFRVFELKSLLRDLGVSTNGRKNELYLRVLHQFDLQNARVEELIVAIHEKRFPHSKVQRTKSPVKTSNTSPTKRQTISQQQHVVLPDVRFKSLPFYDVVDTIVKPTSLGRSQTINT